ncbi:phosphoribosylformylglycinamidine synthase subunit PurL [Candidatus Micrarchaeota archaeon]|nr:phosphoribosylformylglycinamidine synthase subunit PurL [Candidatus Micrarchaeota archaeon]
MAGRIEIATKEGIKDVIGGKTADKIRAELGIDARVHFSDVYSFDGEIAKDELNQLAVDVFADFVAQKSSTEPFFKSLWRVEIGFLPGVTDNVGKTARAAVREKTGKEYEIFYSRLYSLAGNLNREQCERIAAMLYNQLVEKAILHHPGQEPPPYLPKVSIKHEPKVERISLHMSSVRFEQLAKERLLALSQDEFKAIKTYFKDEKIVEERKKVGLDNKVTDVEIEAIAQTWSEHCKHKIFNAKISYREDGETHAINSLFSTFIKNATEQIKKPYVVSVFKDNGGIIKLNAECDIAVKVETHNAPSALDPYGGALTGVLGVQRDIMGVGLGAKPIANIDVLCFGYPDEKEIPKGVLHPKVIYEGVVKGIEDGGNKMGIPTVNGSILFDKKYTCRPLVYCGTIGVMPSTISGRKTSEKKIEPGYLAVMAGGRIGKDGIHGATFSSQQIDESIPQSVVQIGDPITQKKMFDFTIEARDALLYDAITDNGAGGLSSSIGELARISGGCEIHLDRCPLKYPGLDPWEILISESQERMTLALPEGNLEKLKGIAAKHDVEITVVGKFTDSGRFHVLYGGQTVAYLDLDFLHEGLPQMNLTASWKKLVYPEPRIDDFDAASILKKLLSSPNITTKENVIRRYDHEVQGNSVIKPIMLGPNDAAVMKAVYSSNEGIVISHGICPQYVQDSYAMAALAFDEAVRNAVAVGGRFGYLACLDNFSWPDPIKSQKTPDGEYKLGQLVRACIALYDCATSYGIPLISGKDSMKNDYYDGEKKYSIPPTLLITVVGKIDDIEKAVSSEFKRSGDLIYVLGKTREEMGGSAFYRLFGGVGNNPPQVRPDEHIQIYRALTVAMSEGLVESAHDVSEGGLAAAFAESALGPDCGAELDLALIPAATQNDNALMFSESAGRFVVSVKPENAGKFESAMKNAIFAKAGRVRGDRRLLVKRGERMIMNEDVGDLKNAYMKGVP